MKSCKISIKKIKEYEEELNDQVADYLNKAIDLRINSSFPETVYVFLKFVKRTDDIKDEIIDMCEKEHLFVSKILYRCLIDYSLKCQYVFLRFIKEKSENAAIDYNKFCDMSEMIMYGKKWQTIFKTLEEKPFDYRIPLSEIIEDFSKYEDKEIIKIADNFKYDNIIKFIQNNYFKGESFVNSPLLKLLPEYSELSSFVHGGPYADRYMLSFRDDSELRKELYVTAKMSSRLASLVKVLALRVYTFIDRSYSQVLNKIEKMNDDFYSNLK